MKYKRLSKIISFVFLLGMGMIWIFPTVWGFTNSFRTQADFIRNTNRLIPTQWVLSSYAAALNSTSAPLMTWFRNSVVISVSHVFLVVVVVSLAAFGYTRLQFKGRDAIFFFLLGTMMFPGVVNLIPLFAIVNTFGWINSPLAAIIPGASGVFNIFLVRQFMLGIPMELDESARMDGASDLKIFLFIIVPLIRPVLTVVALFSFVGSWNDFLWPSIVFTDMRRLPLTPGLQLAQGSLAQIIPSVLAGAMIAIAPTLLLFLMVQKYFVSSLSLSAGIKG